MSKPIPYIQQIGSLDTKQFRKLQEMLEPLNEVERMEILYRQLEEEIKIDKENANKCVICQSEFVIAMGTNEQDEAEWYCEKHMVDDEP